MLVNFKTEAINLNELKKNEKSVILVEGDIIVPDINPDIAKILLIDAKASVSEKALSGKKINTSGVIFLNLLYVPEKTDDNSPDIKSINTKLAFSDSFDCPFDNPDFTVCASVENITYSAINSRKVNVKITVSLANKIYVPKTVTFLTAADDDTDMEIKKKPMHIYTNVIDVQKRFTYSETIDVPSAKGDIDELLKTKINITKGDCKITENKIILRGSLNISNLYSSFDGGYIHEYMEHELPFSEILDVDGLEENSMCNVTYSLDDYSVSVKNDLNGDARFVEFSAVICANITTSKIYDLDIIDDCYIPHKNCEIKKETVNLLNCLSIGTSRASLKNIIATQESDMPISAVYNLSFAPKIRRCTIEGDMLHIDGDITAFLLYCSGENNTLCTIVAEFPFEHHIELDSPSQNATAQADVTIISSSYNILSENEVEVRVGLEFFVQVTELNSCFIISQCEVSDDNVESTTPITIYFVQDGETLWDIAKRYRTTTKIICDTNNIDENILRGQKLLITSA